MSLPRTVATALDEIGTLLELQGTDARARTFHAAARGRSDALAVPEVADAVTELEFTGGSLLLDELRETTPEGLFEMLRLAGLGPATIRRIHVGLGVDSLAELERSARDGRLAALPRFGTKMADRVLRSISAYRAEGAPLLLPHAQAEGARLAAVIAARPGVRSAVVAGEIRRHLELVHDIVVVASCDGDPAAAAAALADAPDVEVVSGMGSGHLELRLAGGIRAHVRCVAPPEFGVALLRATGSATHVEMLERAATAAGLRLTDSALVSGDGRVIATADERDVYAALAIPFVPPELRDAEHHGAEVERRGEGALIGLGDLQGVLHCHSSYSDGGAAIADIADAARRHGWRYIGVTDHSQSALNAGGMSAERILQQHREIDAVNASQSDVRVLKGIEADILPCGRVDYPVSVLDSFDFVIASIHTRMGMNEAQMTERILKALDDPHVTILGHPTGRLLLTREPYAVDIEAILRRAGERGVAVELNADPHRLDLDWRALLAARRHGVTVSIGPDAHTLDALDHAALGVGMARKAGLEARDVLNARALDGVLSFAARRRAAA